MHCVNGGRGVVAVDLRSSFRPQRGRRTAAIWNLRVRRFTSLLKSPKELFSSVMEKIRKQYLHSFHDGGKCPLEKVKNFKSNYFFVFVYLQIVLLWTNRRGFGSSVSPSDAISRNYYCRILKEQRWLVME